jgi:hypothetical protein
MGCALANLEERCSVARCCSWRLCGHKLCMTFTVAYNGYGKKDATGGCSIGQHG